MPEAATSPCFTGATARGAEPDDEPRLLHEFFLRSARRWPENIAIEVPPSSTRPNRRSITYFELDRRSDALANWFLADSESGEKPWLALDGIGSDRELEIFISEARQFQAMRNDDVTLLCLEVVD